MLAGIEYVDNLISELISTLRLQLISKHPINISFSYFKDNPGPNTIQYSFICHRKVKFYY